MIAAPLIFPSMSISRKAPSCGSHSNGVGEIRRSSDTLELLTRYHKHSENDHPFRLCQVLSHFLAISCQTDGARAGWQRLFLGNFIATLKEGTMGLGRILVVDDEAHIRTTIKMVLSKAGYDVVEAEDGEKGIQAIKSDDNALMVDMILCDMQMPKIDGVGAIAHFRAQFPSVPVVVMTGHPDIQAATKLMKQGVKDYLVKPIEKEKLLAVVEDAVKHHVLFKDNFHA